MKSPFTSDTILVAARTERGRRSENQDASTSFTSAFGFVYLLADGMGGMQGGRTASSMTAEGYRKYLTSLPATLSSPEALQRATTATNAEIRQRGQSGDPTVAGMGSTVVLAVFANTEAGLRGTIAHIGDSRAYLLRRGVLSRLTRDHSALQRLIDNHEITEEEARNHPDVSVITRALGSRDEVSIEVSEHIFESGDSILLCSDGLSGFVEDSAIADELAKRRELVDTAEALVALALDSGSSDNITVQVLQVVPASTTERIKTLPAPLPADARPLQSETSPEPKTFSYRSTIQRAAILLAGFVFGLLVAAPFMHLTKKGTEGRAVSGSAASPIRCVDPGDGVSQAPGVPATPDKGGGPEAGADRKEHARKGSRPEGAHGARLHPAKPSPETSVGGKTPVPRQGEPVSRDPNIHLDQPGESADPSPRAASPAPHKSRR